MPMKLKPKLPSTYLSMLSLLFTVIGVILDSLTLIILGILAFFCSVSLVILREKRQSAIVPLPHERFRVPTIIIVGAVIFILLALKLIGII